MSSIKQLIINAIIKVSGENPALDAQSEFSAVEARDDFIRCLMLELFPEESAAVTVAVTETAAPATSPKKAKKSKVAKTAEEPAAPASPATSPKKAKKAKVAKTADEPASPATSPKEAKKAKVAKTEKDAAKAAAAAAKEAEKATKAAEKEAAKAAKTAAKEAKKATPPASPAKAASPKKAAKAPKVKPAEDANLPKMDPTWRKHLKKADKAATKESESELLTYLNALTKEEFNAKKAEEHVAHFLASRVTAEDGKEPADLTEVDFQGKTYYVNPESKRVYEGEGEYDNEVGWTHYKPVGYVGMAMFAEMEV
jgi:hypothetical protein